MPDRRRIGALLLVFGYLGVVGGSVAWIVSYWNMDPYHVEITVYQTALALGIGLAGLACWRWTATSRSPTTLRGPTRWMAAASLVLAAAPTAQTYETYDNHRQLLRFPQHASAFYPHYRLLIAGGVAFTAGLLLAAIGFWALGSATRVSSAELVLDHEEGAIAG